MAVTNTTRVSYTDDQWAGMKPLIEQKYIVEALTLEQTMEALRKEQDFHATEKMYKTRIKRWKMSKYIKDDKAMAVLTGHDDGLHRAHTVGSKPTINGRAITKEEAERHIRRKKRPNTVPGPVIASLDTDMEVEPMVMDQPMHQPMNHQPMHMDIPNNTMFDTSDILVSPDMDQQGFNTFPERVPSWSRAGSFDRRGTLTNGIMSPEMPAEEYDDVIMNMDLVDMAAGNDMQMGFMEDRPVNPRLLGMGGLSWTTESFLTHVQRFAILSINAVHGRTMQPYQEQRFNKLWDLFCTDATHREQNKIHDALITRKQAQRKFENMLTSRDPWLLLSLCLLLNDYLSNPKRIAMTSDFLNEMATWAENVDPDHPITLLVRHLQQSDDAKDASALTLLEGTIRMITDTLKGMDYVYPDLSLEISRLHARIMTTSNMHHSAIALLSEDLAVVENHYGPDSLPNLLRRSSLARAHFMADNFDISLDIYQKILTDPLLDQPHLADIKFGAMYFIAKSHAALGNLDEAIFQAQQALLFSVTARKEDHYWVTNSKDLIKEFKASQRSMVSVFGQKVRDGIELQTWGAQNFAQFQPLQFSS